MDESQILWKPHLISSSLWVSPLILLIPHPLWNLGDNSFIAPLFLRETITPFMDPILVSNGVDAKFDIHPPLAILPPILWCLIGFCPRMNYSQNILICP